MTSSCVTTLLSLLLSLCLLVVQTRQQEQLLLNETRESSSKISDSFRRTSSQLISPSNDTLFVHRLQEPFINNGSKRQSSSLATTNTSKRSSEGSSAGSSEGSSYSNESHAFWSSSTTDNPVSSYFPRSLSHPSSSPRQSFNTESPVQLSSIFAQDSPQEFLDHHEFLRMNSSSTDSDSFEVTPYSMLLSFTLVILILATIVGNVFVITAIMIDRNLRTIGNSLVFSLAVADLMVALLVMPIAAIVEVNGKWTFGPLFCDVFTSLDVLSCTASILHLVAIALDRFWAVTNVEYIHCRSPTSVGKMIFCVWIVSLVISVAPILGWKDDKFMERITIDKECLISQDVAYQVLATVTTFYAPLVVILLLYWRIFNVSTTFSSVI